VTVPKIFLSQLPKILFEGGDIRITFLTTIGIERKGLRFADARKTNQPTQADYVRGRFDPLPISSMVDEFLNRRMYYCSQDLHDLRFAVMKPEQQQRAHTPSQRDHRPHHSPNRSYRFLNLYLSAPTPRKSSVPLSYPSSSSRISAVFVLTTFLIASLRDEIVDPARIRWCQPRGRCPVRPRPSRRSRLRPTPAIRSRLPWCRRRLRR